VDKIVLIMAAGAGLRMQGSSPKQFLPLGGLPLLMRTIGVFYEWDSLVKIIVVLPEAFDRLVSLGKVPVSRSI